MNQIKFTRACTRTRNVNRNQASARSWRVRIMDDSARCVDIGMKVTNDSD